MYYHLHITNDNTYIYMVRLDIYLPVAANIAATIGGYTHNARKIRIVGMVVNSPLWIIYDIMVGSWAGIFDEIVSECSMLISIVRYGWKNLDRINE